ncbi:RdgB/HAM1 family non-canonical purine NTP pyrophosphatase [Pasteurellaceae bacterium 20609_3]|uniref:RdgB/HAM1 family non-canonical purine NTP pyrophosphatase n=1 Tax=Spirabiliibacterium mucosae TaxID=28156 RepID=UPI001AAC562C|nr:RdgB/HAM1 family non-canonical purine NTP pyrophosphatase [Spirabiliibacterium mucosae]MBE2897925.1 RdgB/HAM1 family non-canonical purine NTP pyrophosphatase [Spirabiliibacterium mucosae]
MSKQKVVLATGNAGKVREMASAIGALGFEVVSQTALGIESAVEDGLTFVENALKKARHAAAQSGLPAIADDSGLVVAALNGAPGLYSARYAGEEASDSDNCAKLLQALRDVPDGQRQAKFVSVIVFLRHAEDPNPIIAQGECVGEIARALQGDNGFGYDPLFFYPSKNRTFAQLSLDEKHALSHRGKALDSLKSQLTGVGA